MNEIVSEEAGKLVVRLEGEVDLDGSPAVRKLLFDCITRQMDVVVDLSGVQYIDSSGIASLVEGLQAANGNGTKFSLVAVSGQVRRVMELARLDKVFKIFDDVDAALAPVASVA
ncbi:MAG: STAS domain-containing protein [Rhodospirillales bacterium]|nr:STAS domain-containing protein [Rhodospirillales bacterium]